MTAKLSEQLWQENEDLARACLECRFVHHLGEGTLPAKAFRGYIAQDAYFLEAFSRAYAFALAYSKSREWIFQFAELLNGVLKELDLHDGYAAEWKVDLSTTEPMEATLDYTGFLLRVAQSGDVGETCAAMTPCMRLYAYIGQQLARRHPHHQHTYSEWIKVYASPSFEGLAMKLELAFFQAHEC